MVLIGVPDRAGLAEAIRKITQWSHGYYAWFEPDFDLGLTAVATVPLDREAKKLLSNYALWRPITSLVSSAGRASCSPQKPCEVGGSIPSQGTSSPIYPSSSEKEQPASAGRSVVQFHPGVPTSPMCAISSDGQSRTL